MKKGKRKSSSEKALHLEAPSPDTSAWVSGLLKQAQKGRRRLWVSALVAGLLSCTVLSLAVALLFHAAHILCR